LKRAGNETGQEVSRSAPADRTACPQGARPKTVRSVVVGAAEPKSTPTASLIERVERALVLLAYFIEVDGDVHLAMYEKFETELHGLKQKESTKERARRLLLDYSRSGSLNAICSRNLSLSSSDGPRPYFGL